MDHSSATKIVQEFGKILRENSQSLPAPLSLLPYSKEDIMKAMLTYLYNLEYDYQKNKNALEISYMALGSFIPDEDLVDTLNMDETLSENNFDVLANNLKSDKWDKTLVIQDKIFKEQGRLSEEIGKLSERIKKEVEKEFGAENNKETNL